VKHIVSNFRVEEKSRARNQSESMWQAELGLFDPQDAGDVPPKRRPTLNGLHGVISQKIVPPL
jgi:hypothetical protein